MEDQLNIMEPILTELIVISYEGEVLDEDSNLYDISGKIIKLIIHLTFYEKQLSDSDPGLNKIAGQSYHGQGTATMDNDCVYTGQFKHGLFHGHGKFTWKDGTVYTGDFVHGQVRLYDIIPLVLTLRSWTL